MTSNEMCKEEKEQACVLAEKAWEEVLETCVAVQMAIPENPRSELSTYWSTEAVGYVLFINGEGGRRVVDVNSTRFAGQVAVSSFLGDMRGIVRGSKKTRHIVWTAPVEICCDNQGTVSRLRKGQVMGDDVRCSRLIAWLLGSFPQAQFECVPGARNQIADRPSRSKSRQKGEEEAVGVVSVGQRPPDSVVRRRLEQAHRGHWHAERTRCHLKRDGPAWPGARKEVLRYVKQRPDCQHFRGLEHREPWAGTATTRPNDVAFGDFLGPLTLSRDRGKRVVWY